jgi:uncharacterized repeat protein (TIGR04138 family)
MRHRVARARVSIARVMRWVACLAVVFAGARHDAAPLSALAAALAGLVLGYDLIAFLVPRAVRRPWRVGLVGNRPMPFRAAMTAEQFARFEAALHAGGFRLESVLFLQSAFRSLCDSPPPPDQPDRAVDGHPGLHHITAAELCAALAAHAAARAGGPAAAAALLSCLGLRRGEDVGALVFTMIDFGLVRRRPDDSPDDFRGRTILPSRLA